MPSFCNDVVRPVMITIPSLIMITHTIMTYTDYYYSVR